MPPGPAHDTSGTARLILGAPSYAVGWQEPAYVPQPAAGAQWKYTADGRYFERVLAVRFNFVASAAVTNRYVELVLRDANGVAVAAVPAVWGITAGNGAVCYLSVRGPAYQFAATGDVFGFMPDFLIPPGWSWGTSTPTMDAGDQFSNVVVLAQRFPNDAAQISVPVHQ